MRAILFSRLTRFLTAFLLAVAILGQSAALAGPIGKKGFTKREKAGFEKLEARSAAKTKEVKGRSGDGLINARSLLVVAGLVGIGIWAANSDYEEDECIINGKKIDPHSSECRAAAHLAESHSD